MRLVLSLIAAKAKLPLGASDVARARAALEAAGARTSPPDWLSPGEACDIPCEPEAPEDEAAAGKLRLAARAALSGLPFDINVVPGAQRRKRLFLADMDSTMIGQECVDELAAKAGLREKVAAITERAMRGEIAFAPALRERVALLKGLPLTVVADVLSERITLTAGGRVLVATMRAAGVRTILVSGGFSSFVAPIAERIGFDAWRANTLLAADGCFSGEVAEPILGADAKHAALVEARRELALTAAETLAVGDGANDAAMVAEAGLGVAFRAKPALRAVADAEIDHADLTGLLFLQGYRRAEFIGG